MQRTPEPELMDDPDQARAYAEADFDEANALFLELFARHFPHHTPLRALDLGCGPGKITLQFAACHRKCHMLGIDAAGTMLAFAHRNLERHPGMKRRVAFRKLHIPSEDLDGHYDTLLSNSLLHHLENPLVLWREILRRGTPGSAVLVMDLRRPQCVDAARRLVQRYAGQEPPVLQRDFFNSLCAAYTEKEIRRQLQRSGLRDLRVETVSDRHLVVYGYLKRNGR